MVAVAPGRRERVRADELDVDEAGLLGRQRRRAVEPARQAGFASTVCAWAQPAERDGVEARRVTVGPLDVEPTGGSVGVKADGSGGGSRIGHGGRLGRSRRRHARDCAASMFPHIGTGGAVSRAVRREPVHSQRHWRSRREAGTLARMSTTVVATAITSGIGCLLNVTVLLLVLYRGRRSYHYLFAGFLAVCVLWDGGVCLSMVRNNDVAELPVYGRIIWWPCTFMFALIYHFVCAYLGQPRRIRTAFAWVFCTLGFIGGVTGLMGTIEGVWHYSWGNIYRPDEQLLTGALLSLPVGYAFGLSALWYLFQAWKRELAPLRKRHLLYILVSLAIVHVAVSKVGILYGIDNGFWMPACMLFNDVAAALVGVAIVKDHLLDVTLIVKKATLYSALVALIAFVFALSEHFLASFFASLAGEASALAHVLSVAAVIAVVMPLRKRGEGMIEDFFARRRLEL
jgi:hypothetical protein